MANDVRKCVSAMSIMTAAITFVLGVLFGVIALLDSALSMPFVICAVLFVISFAVAKRTN